MKFLSSTLEDPQSFTKYLRLTLVFMPFASINKIFILAGKLGTMLLLYEVFKTFLIFPNFLRS